MTNQRIVLAFNGRPASCAAARWLATTSGGADLPTSAEATVGRQIGPTHEIIALIVDVGQGEDPEETRSRALACGAQRVHVLKRLDEFARRAIIPAAAVDEPLGDRALRQLAYPVIAAALVEVAAMENADTVAHGSGDDALDAEIHALAPHVRVIAPAREGNPGHVDAQPAPAHPDRHLLLRGRVMPAASGSTATVAIAFEAGIPVSVNGVPMALPELIESLSLIGGQYRVHGSNNTPALTLLQNAYRVSHGHGCVSLHLQSGSLVVSSSEATSGPAEAGRYDSELVNHA